MPRPPAPARTDALRALGIHGWTHLEPVILAALATEAPLLLIGPHGSAKTLVLTKLAAALGLAHRHYNASLLNFDDLVGFPVPKGERLVYLQTPSTIWDAESVLFDEVSRCRPEIQNKLFPIVHERNVQGLPLERLRHRWAAMNPPPSIDSRDEPHEYAGAEPLDVALADRFAFIVRVPGLTELSRDDQLSLLRTNAAAGGNEASKSAPTRLLRRTLREVRAEFDRTPDGVHAVVAEYVQIVGQKLSDAGHPISTRRAVQLCRNVVAVRAALAAERWTRADDEGGSWLEDAFFTALRHSLPDAAWGAPIPQATLLAVHRSGWELARAVDCTRRKTILLEPDPVRRIALALAAPPDVMSASAVGQVLSDGWTALPRVKRIATAAVLGPLVTQRPDLPVACLELIARDYAQLAQQSSETITVRNGGADWRRKLLSADLGRLDAATERGKTLTNAAVVLMKEDEQFKLSELQAGYDHARAALKPVRV